MGDADLRFTHACDGVTLVAHERLHSFLSCGDDRRPALAGWSATVVRTGWRRFLSAVRGDAMNLLPRAVKATVRSGYAEEVK